MVVVPTLPPVKCLTLSNLLLSASAVKVKLYNVRKYTVQPVKRHIRMFRTGIIISFSKVVLVLHVKQSWLFRKIFPKAIQLPLKQTTKHSQDLLDLQNK